MVVDHQSHPVEPFTDVVEWIEEMPSVYNENSDNERCCSHRSNLRNGLRRRGRGRSQQRAPPLRKESLLELEPPLNFIAKHTELPRTAF